MNPWFCANTTCFSQSARRKSSGTNAWTIQSNRFMFYPECGSRQANPPKQSKAVFLRHDSDGRRADRICHGILAARLPEEHSSAKYLTSSALRKTVLDVASFWLSFPAPRKQRSFQFLAGTGGSTELGRFRIARCERIEPNDPLMRNYFSNN